MDCLPLNTNPLGLDPKMWSYSSEVEEEPHFQSVYEIGGILGVISFIFKSAILGFLSCFGRADVADMPTWLELTNYTTTTEIFRLSEKNRELTDYILTDYEASSILRRYDINEESRLTADKLREVTAYAIPLKLGNKSLTHRINPAYRIITVRREGVIEKSMLSVFAKRGKNPTMKNGVREDKSEHIYTFDPILPKKNTRAEIDRRMTKGLYFSLAGKLDQDVLDSATGNMDKSSVLDAEYLGTVIDFFNGKKVVLDHEEKEIQFTGKTFSGEIGALKVLRSTQIKKGMTNDKGQAGVLVTFGRVAGVDSTEEATKKRVELETIFLRELKQHSLHNNDMIYQAEVSDIGIVSLTMIDRKINFDQGRKAVLQGLEMPTLEGEGEAEDVLTYFYNIAAETIPRLKENFNLTTVKSVYSVSDMKTGFSLSFDGDKDSFAELRAKLDEKRVKGVFTKVEFVDGKIIASVLSRSKHMGELGKPAPNKITPRVQATRKATSKTADGASTERQQARDFLDMAGVPNHSAGLRTSR